MVMVRDTSKEEQFFRSRSKVRRIRADLKPNREITTALVKGPVKNKKGNAFQHSRTGFRSDLGDIMVRSGWEANVVRVLNLLKVEFEFEPTTFEFPPNRNGRHQSYLPDFYLTKTGEYVEVKGYLDGKGRNKLRKFKRTYPEEFKKLSVVISRSSKANILFFTKLGVQNILYYENIRDLYGSKVHWEGK